MFYANNAIMSFKVVGGKKTEYSKDHQFLPFKNITV